MDQTVTKVYSIPNFNATGFENLAAYFPRITQEVEVRNCSPRNLEGGKRGGRGEGITFASLSRLDTSSPALSCSAKLNHLKKQIYNGNTDHLYCNGNSSFIRVKNIRELKFL